MTLAEQLEAATADQQRELLMEAWSLLIVKPYLDSTRVSNTVPLRVKCHTFKTKLAAEAYLDAAMMLVPEGWCWMAGERNPGKFRAYVNNNRLMSDPKCEWYEVVAASTALALAAAAIRAKGTDNG